jgi:sortase A
VIKSGVSAWHRRAEIALFVLGSTSLGWAVAMTVNRIVFQEGQARTFSKMERAAAVQPDSRAGARADAGADPLLLGRIEIPRLGLSAIVREGDDDATLAVAVGHIPGTARPGERGNVVLAGHRDSFFRALRGIRRHDMIRICTPRRQDDYVVDSTEVVGPKEIRVLESTRDGLLTLVTCYPFGFVGRAPKRFIVRASLIPKEQ